MALPVSWRLAFPQVNPLTGFGEPGRLSRPGKYGRLSRAGGQGEVMFPNELVLAIPASNQEPTLSGRRLVNLQLERSLVNY